MRKWRLLFTPALFTPAEAERLAGVSTTLQRDWRRRGILPATEGHARFDVFQMMELWALKALADRGVGPGESAKAAKSIARNAVARALQERPAWREALPGDFSLDGRWEWRTIANFGRTVSGTWADRAARLTFELFADRLSGLMYYQPLDGHYCIWWDDGEVRVVASLDAAFDSQRKEGRGLGVSVVIDLRVLTMELMRQMNGRPLVEVTAEEVDDDDSAYYPPPAHVIVEEAA